MKTLPEDFSDVLRCGLSGYHQYILTPAFRLGFLSENLCRMLGYLPQELPADGESWYFGLVPVRDRARLRAFLRDLSRQEAGTHSLDYTLCRKDGSALRVRDTVTLRRGEDGSLIGDSVLTDITDLREEIVSLRDLNETIPYGFLRYTCERQPKVTYVNQWMKDLLRVPREWGEDSDYLELYKQNVYLMIPMEERQTFARFLERARHSEAPVAGELPLLRCDGTKAYFFGWINRCVTAQGREEFQCVCMDVTERHLAKKDDQARRYLKALSDVYDRIFRVDLSGRTVSCLQGQDSPVFQWLENVPVGIDEALESWIAATVAEADRVRVQAFFASLFRADTASAAARPPKLTYEAKAADGTYRLFRGIYLNMDDHTGLYCCRRAADSREAERLRSQTQTLREDMQDLVLRFTEGEAAFEITGDLVTPLYASDNVCAFFGYTREEWLPLMKKATPIRSFTSRSKAANETIAWLLRNGEAEFTYFDLARKRERRIKAISSRPSPESSNPRYIMLYNLDDGEAGAKGQPPGPSVVIRTFGYFDVFVNGVPIAFRNKKSKELFALLVDRRGGYVSSEEAIGFLWEEEPVCSVTLSRYRKVALRLKNILEEYGIANVVESVDGKRRIVTEKVRCDLYDYLSGQTEYANLFKGSYLSNYSWGETTLAELSCPEDQELYRSLSRSD